MSDSFLGKFLDYYDRLPMLVRALITSFFGSSFAGLLSISAAYYFAFRHGMRLPFEGVPYLSLMVFLTLFMIIAAGYPMLFFCKKNFGPRLDQVINMDRLHAWNLSEWIRTIFGSVLILAAAVGIISLLLWIAGLSHILKMNWSVISALLLHAFVLIASLAHRTSRKYLPEIATAVFLIASLQLLFTRHYDSALRLMRVGGGIEVDLRFAKGDRRNPENLQMNLLLLTNERVVLVDANEHIIEIPLTDVVSISYRQFPNWIAARSSALQQFRYFRCSPESVTC